MKARAALERLWPLLVLLASLPLLVLFVSFFSGTEGPILKTLIYLIVVVGIWIFVGNSGVLSFGHISFMAIGGYLAGLLSISETTKSFILPSLPGILADNTFDPVLATLVAAAVAGIFALVAGFPLMRLSGLAASIATLAVLVIVNVVIINAEDVTGGQTTLTQIPIHTTIGNALVISMAVVVIAYLYGQSRTGRRLRASREDLIAARALGIGEFRDRLIAFCVSALIVSVAGSLYAFYLGSVSPTSFYLDTTFLTIAMLVVGGMRSLAGAVVGTVTVSLISELFIRLQNEGVIEPGLRELVLAVLLIVILVLRPDGITRGREFTFPKRWRRSADGKGTLPPAADLTAVKDSQPTN